MSLKVLVCGDVHGNFKQLFSRVSAVQKKAGNFDMLLCSGTFFGDNNAGWEDYKSGEVKVPIQTLVLGPLNEKHKHLYGSSSSDGELCPNVTHLGNRGHFTGSSGLSIAYLGGVDERSPRLATAVTFSASDAQALTVPVTGDSKFQGVDILLTPQWPRGVEKYGTAPDGVDSTKIGSEIISQVAMELKPRYHFCATEESFYERQPYRNHKVLQQSSHHVTRFIALAKVGNPQKKKFLYAFNITPLKKMDAAELVKQPEDVTECPYKLNPSLLTSGVQKQDQSAQFFYDQGMLDRGSTEAPRGGKKRGQNRQDGPTQKRHPQPTGPCWFCLGSPEVEKHLVVSVATNSYLALAKGGLNEHHVMILPIGHHQSTVSSPDDVIEEIDKYKSALRKHYRSQGKAAVFFERNYKTQHLQIQVVAVPADLADEVKDTFQACALSQDMELHEIPKMSDLKQIIPEGAPYFYVELPSGDKLLYRIKKGFPLQFGREALAHDSLLDLPSRVDWRNCKSTKEEETNWAKEFRQKFKKYDFNLQP